MRQSEEAPGFIGDILEVHQAARLPNDVEQVAMFARGGVGLMLNCT